MAEGVGVASPVVGRVCDCVPAICPRLGVCVAVSPFAGRLEFVCVVPDVVLVPGVLLPVGVFPSGVALVDGKVLFVAWANNLPSVPDCC
ncbi:MAG: hypothetical protein H7Z43_03715 [Clostridia bacterium]|nr:hypothetical protein [Deltaproteobacteria bacterium]